MNATSRTIAKNAGFLMLSQIVMWAFTLPQVIVVSRSLGPAKAGTLTLANSIWSIVAVVATFGVDILLTKEIARNPGKTAEFVSISTILRSALFIVGTIAIALYAHLVGYSQEAILILYLIGLSTLFNLWTSSIRSALQGLERMEYSSFGDTASKAFLTIVSIIVLLLGYGVIPFVVVVIASGLINLVIQLVALYRVAPLRWYFNWNAAWEMLKSGVPYLTSTVFLVAYAQVDMIIISTLVSVEAVGWYGVADRLTGTFMFIPGVFVAAIFPVLSRLFTNSPESLPRLMSKSFDLMLITGVPIGFGILAIANQLVILLFGKDFANSGPILAIRGIVLILTYMTMILGYFCISTDKQKAWSLVMVAATLLTIPLDFILVPICQKFFGNGAIGGSLSFLITEAGMVIVGLHLLPKKTLGWANVWVSARVLLAGLLMVITIWLLRGLFIAIPIILGGLTYLILIFLFRVLTVEEWLLIKYFINAGLIRLHLLNSPTAGLNERNL